MSERELTELENNQAELDDENVTGGGHELRSQLAHEYEDAQRGVRYFSLDWDAYEDLLYVQSRTPDNLHVRISEGSLSTMIIERSARVVGQIPSGKVNAMDLKSQGSALLLDLIMHKYVFPGAKSQFDLKTKLRIWDMKSNLYGIMPMQYDWVVRDDYTGPDCWLVPIRNFFPQQGRMSIRECDFVFISNFVSRDMLLEILEDETETYDLDAIQEVLADTKGKALVPKAEYNYFRRNPFFEIRRRTPWTNTGQFEVVTKYEAGDEGRWISFLPDYGNRVIRNIFNPHQSSKIPVVLKTAIPTDDSIVALGDGERGRYIQYAMDTTVNLQIDGQKLRTYPPLKVVESKVVMPTLRYQPGAKILVDEPEAITTHDLPDNTNVLNTTYQFLKGALSNVTGTTTTQVAAESNSAVQGKTPQAIQAQQQSESTRDEMDRELLELACEELFGAFIDLINTKQTDPIELYLFGEEVQQIQAQGYDDIMDSVELSENGKALKITIKPNQVKNKKGFKYEIDAGSSSSKDTTKQNQQLQGVMEMVMQNPQMILQLLQAGGKTLDFAELMKELIITGGIDEWNKIIKPIPVQNGVATDPNEPQEGETPQTPPQATGEAMPQNMMQQPQMGQEMQPAAPQQAESLPEPQMLTDPALRQAHAVFREVHGRLSAAGGGQNA